MLLRTGRHGESWELLFHADRSFDKVRIDEPVSGTKITLFKHMEPERVAPFVREAKWVLGYWCEHSDLPITFDDRTNPEQEAAGGDVADPFAAFAGEATETREQVNSPLNLGSAHISMKLEDEDLLLGLGYDDRPRFGFYNGGLTLVSSTSAEVLGEFTDLAHLAFKVKCNALEHTLTRDNVLQDDEWRRVMQRVRVHAATLRGQLVERIEAAVAAGEPLDLWHGFLAEEVRVHGRELMEKLDRRPLFRDDRGEPMTLRELEKQEDALGAVLLTPRHERLAAELRAQGHRLLDPEPNTRRLLLSFERYAMIGMLRAERLLQSADERFVLPDLLERDELTSRERRMVDATLRLLDSAMKGAFTLRLGDFGGAEAAVHEVLALEGPEGGGLFTRADDVWLSLPSFGRKRRCLLVNRHHELFRALVVASAEELPVAAFALAQALLVADGTTQAQATLRSSSSTRWCSRLRHRGGRMSQLDALLERSRSARRLRHPQALHPGPAQGHREDAGVRPAASPPVRAGAGAGRGLRRRDLDRHRRAPRQHPRGVGRRRAPDGRRALENIFDYLFVDQADLVAAPPHAAGGGAQRHLPAQAQAWCASRAATAPWRAPRAWSSTGPGRGAGGQAPRRDSAAPTSTWSSTRGWWERFFSSRQPATSPRLVEERCLYTPVPILLNGSAPFRLPQQPSHPAVRRDRRRVTLTSRSAGAGAVGVVRSQRCGPSSASWWGACGWARRTSSPSWGPGLGGVIADDHLRKTADMSDPRARRALGPHAPRGAARRPPSCCAEHKGQGYSPSSAAPHAGDPGDRARRGGPGDRTANAPVPVPIEASGPLSSDRAVTMERGRSSRPWSRAPPCSGCRRGQGARAWLSHGDPAEFPFHVLQLTEGEAVWLARARAQHRLVPPGHLAPTSASCSASSPDGR